VSRRTDFQLFWTSQTISSVGSSFTTFALPLLVFKLTGSAVGLALTTVTGFLPYLLFGLVIGAWVDRLDRRKAMIFADLTRLVLIGTIPTLAWLGALQLPWVYGVAFLNTTMWIVCTAAESAAIPSLVAKPGLMTANGRLQGSYAAAQVLGPLLAGALIGGGLPVTAVFAVDSVSFAISAAILAFVRTPFNLDRPHRRESGVLNDVRTGLTYVFTNPVLRGVALVAALFNLLGATTWSQLVLFAHTRLTASDGRISLVYAGASAGSALILLAAGRLNRRFSFLVMTLGALVLWSVLVLALALSTNFWIAAAAWSAAAGLPSLYAVRTLSLRQEIVPEHLLARVQTIAQVLAWSAQPLGALAGAWVIQATGHISAVYAGCALLVLATALSYWHPLKRALREVEASADRVETGHQ
jgi:MFS family permease